jgi:glycosyltransferase involved in cell wall biosynthesis
MIGRDLERGNEELDKLVERTGCAERIHLMGERQDVEALSRASDVHVLASIGGEGFPNAVAETMLCATPNVVTNVGDAALIAGNTGWVVEPGDPQLLAAAIEDAYRERTGSPDRWAERRAASRERIVKEFPLKRMIAAYEEVWEKAARGHGDRRRSSIEVRSGEGKDDPRRLRVLHVINTLNVGGAETLLYRLVTTDPDNDHVVVSLGSPGSYSARLQEKGIRVHHLGMDSVKAAAKGAMRLNAIVRESNADVVQCWMYRSNVFGGVISKAAGKPVVWGVHNTSLEPLTRSARALVYLSGMLAPRAPDFIINCSARSSELHSKLGYQRARAAAVINNGYDAQSFHPDQERRSLTREALGIGAGEFVIGTVARWDPLKDIPNFLAAIRLVHERGIPFRCYAIGTGLRPRNVHFSEAVQSTGCSELVTPLGPRDDVPDLARALDLHVLASRTEAFPNVVAETMLSGTPNAVTDVGDVPTMVGSTGWVAPPCDPARLADAIVAAYHEWKDAPAQWAARRQAARQHIADNFSHERMMAAYQGVWREVAADVAA